MSENKIEYTEDTVFNVGADAIVNTINTMGTMGAGLALEFALRYPEMLEDYKKKCEANEIRVGTVYYCKVENGPLIINFPTKKHYALPSNIRWIEEGLKNFADTYKDYNITSAAFPRLGCSNGKLSWDDVRPLMERYLGGLDIKVYICESTKKEAAGVEKLMVEEYNRFLDGESELTIDLTAKQKNALESRGKVSRFYELNEVQRIKGALYKKVFTAIYKQCTALSCEEQKAETQISLFD